MMQFWLLYFVKAFSIVATSGSNNLIVKTQFKVKSVKISVGMD